jgi:hypothetical protein
VSTGTVAFRWQVGGDAVRSRQSPSNATHKMRDKRVRRGRVCFFSQQIKRLTRRVWMSSGNKNYAPFSQEDGHGHFS